MIKYQLLVLYLAVLITMLKKHLQDHYLEVPKIKKKNLNPQQAHYLVDKKLKMLNLKPTHFLEDVSQQKMTKNQYQALYLVEHSHQRLSKNLHPHRYLVIILKVNQIQTLYLLKSQLDHYLEELNHNKLNKKYLEVKISQSSHYLLQQQVEDYLDQLQEVHFRVEVIYLEEVKLSKNHQDHYLDSKIICLQNLKDRKLQLSQITEKEKKVKEMIMWLQMNHLLSSLEMLSPRQVLFRN